MTRYSIFINEAKFTADESTIDKVIEALESIGFVYHETTEGWVEPGFYSKPTPFPGENDANTTSL